MTELIIGLFFGTIITLISIKFSSIDCFGSKEITELFIYWSFIAIALTIVLGEITKLLCKMITLIPVP